ncbi:DUF4905 domain-containing protein [Pontibacter akesuensis]|uniref:DUF4905 domain-containing protein n=1 Tax=Pontibacter akesuensis TaxID=388950 RepID=A0A1I7GJ86_9BACT|nr:DUF4905 domain-containing protein [Pontibacter akesuensis]GHA56466.1 hypothetical protein GCM10007389_05080 [Pontibacter akesuensis]SFU48562.1 protein of unknown function [Pontibacter akesuensis]
MVFKYDFGAPVWRIRLDSTTSHLALEVRDPDVLLTYFYTLNTENHTLKQLKRPQAQAWWQGLEEAEHGCLYLHGYGNRKLGQHLGILAVSSGSGLKVWEHSDVAYYGLAAAGLLAYDPAQPEKPLQVLDPLSGTQTGRRMSQQEAATAVAQHTISRYADCQYPALYREGEEYFGQVKAFVEAQLGEVVVQALEYAETEAGFVVSFYVAEPDGKLRNELAVFNLDGNLLLQVQLGSSLNGIGSDTFFIFKHNLYFILNRAILQVYRLLV